MVRHWKQLIFFLLTGLLLFVGLRAGWDSLTQPQAEGRFSAYHLSSLNREIGANLPFQTPLRRLDLQLGIWSGQWQQNDIFISREGLIRNIDAPMEMLVQENSNTVIRFAQQAGTPTYLMLVPTASAILQQQLPPYAQIYNQRQMMEGVYRDMAGRVTVLDVYPALFNKRDEYIYYRTEDNLTALGGYYIYNVMAGKMGLESRDLAQYEVQYLLDGYYGDLFQRSPYGEVRPDVLMAFRYRGERSYLLSHLQGDEVKLYHTPYPTHLLELGNPMDVYFGGVSPLTELYSSSPNERTLLVFGDKTALSYLPFLFSSYSRITLVDLFRLSSREYESIDLEEYNQILFAYSVESFDTGIPRLAGRILDQMEAGEEPPEPEIDLEGDLELESGGNRDEDEEDEEEAPPEAFVEEPAQDLGDEE